MRHTTAAPAPDPVVDLNRAATIAQAGDAGGLARMDAPAPVLNGYQYFQTARAPLLCRLAAGAVADGWARALQ